MAWIVGVRICRRTKKPYYGENPTATCSKCGYNVSAYWLRYIADQANCTMMREPGTLPQYCPECGFYHNGEEVARDE